MIVRGSLLSRAAALALLAAPAAALIALMLWPAALRWSAMGDRIEMLREQTARRDAQNASAEALAAVEAQWRAYELDPRAGFFRVADANKAAEAALGRINGIFIAAGGQLQRGGLANSELRAGAEVARISAAGVAPEASIATILAQIEADSPFIIIDRFEAERKANMASVTLEALLYRQLEGGE